MVVDLCEHFGVVVMVVLEERFGDLSGSVFVLIVLLFVALSGPST